MQQSTIRREHTGQGTTRLSPLNHSPPPSHSCVSNSADATSLSSQPTRMPFSLDQSQPLQRPAASDPHSPPDLTASRCSRSAPIHHPRSCANAPRCLLPRLYSVAGFFFDCCCSFERRRSMRLPLAFCSTRPRPNAARLIRVAVRPICEQRISRRCGYRSLRYTPSLPTRPFLGTGGSNRPVAAAPNHLERQSPARLP